MMFAKRVSRMVEALCSAVEQARNCQSHAEVNDVAAVDNRNSSVTMDYTHNDTTGTVFDPGTASVVHPRAPDGIEDCAEEMEALRSQILQIWWSDQHLGTVEAHERSRSPLTSHLSFGFRDATLWCWSGGWSASSRRASRLKDLCGVPTKTGADVVHGVSGGFVP